MVKSLMEEKQEGPEGKQTPRVTGATSSPPSTSVCPATKALTSEKQGDRSIFCTVTCDIRRSHSRIRWIVNIVMLFENIITVCQEEF